MGKDKKKLVSELERLAEADPLRYGHELRVWELADKHRSELRTLYPKGVITELNLGGNRSSKSRRAAKRVVEHCIKNKGRRWWCLDATEAQSRANQQRYIWEFLPAEWRDMATGKLPRTRETKITYSVAGGFSENVLVMPNGSEIAFKFYEMKVGNLPGPELDGVWADELIPYDWIETLQYRLVNRNGILHITFTPELGWTETVAHYLEGATVLEEVEAELLPLFGPDGTKVGCKKVPRVVQCRDPRARIIYFHTQDNPYGNYEGLQKLLEGKSEGEKALRAYGVVEKGHYAAFPLFNEKAHVISINQWEALQRQFPRLQRYMLVDPCSGRNWFMIWVACPALDRWIIYREWPSHGHLGAYVDGFGDPGPWTVISKNPDGAPGPAQKTFGFGLSRYLDEILRIENGEQIEERWIDSRYATARVLDRETTTTLIEQLDELGMFFRAATPERNILGAKDGSIDMINSALYYDLKTPLGQFSAELGRLNAPKLQVVETCPNTIYSLKTWTGVDGQRGASKDSIDTIRMLFLSQVGYLPESAYTWIRY